MQSKNWGAFLCDCRSTVNLDQKIIGAPVPLVKVATNPEEEIHTFAKEAEQQTLSMSSLDAVPSRQFLSKPWQEKHFTSWI